MSAVAEPRPVEIFAGILAEWLSAFTMPQELAGEMADACADGAPWPAAVAGVAARRAGWAEPEAVAWGIAVGAVAGALEAARRSLEPVPPAGRPAEGPALSLLAADGLVAGAHEALSSLPPERLAVAMAALGEVVGDGGPWRGLAPGGSRPAWPAAMALALAPAAREDPAGPWGELAEAWREAAEEPDGLPGDLRALWDHPGADRADRELLQAAADALAGRPDGGEDDLEADLEDDPYESEEE